MCVCVCEDIQASHQGGEQCITGFWLRLRAGRPAEDPALQHNSMNKEGNHTPSHPVVPHTCSQVTAQGSSQLMHQDGWEQDVKTATTTVWCPFPGSSGSKL